MFRLFASWILMAVCIPFRHVHLGINGFNYDHIDLSKLQNFSDTKPRY